MNHLQTNKPEHGFSSHEGCTQTINEDSYLTSTENGIWVVADGVGGHDNGEIASKIAVESIHHSVLSGRNLVEGFYHAHQEILRQSQRTTTESRMAATAVALKLSKTMYEVSWVGDCRAYLWNQKLNRLTNDHTFIQHLVDEGELNEEEARNHPERSFLIQALGSRNIKGISPGYTSGELLKDTLFLLCSDGLTDMLLDEEIANVLSQKTTPQEKTDELIRCALDNKASDNITVLVIST